MALDDRPRRCNVVLSLTRLWCGEALLSQWIQRGEDPPNPMGMLSRTSRRQGHEQMNEEQIEEAHPVSKLETRVNARTTILQVLKHHQVCSRAETEFKNKTPERRPGITC